MIRIFSIMSAALILIVSTLLAFSTGTPAEAQDSRTISNFSLSSDTAGELTISWDTPTDQPRNYRVAWARSDLDFLSWNEPNEAHRGNRRPGGSKTSVTISGLSEGQNYKVKMRARYNNGQGPWTNTENQTVAAGQSSDDTSDGSGSGSGADPTPQPRWPRTLPTATIAAGSNITEGQTAEFTVTIDSPAQSALTVYVAVEETERPHAVNDANSNLVPDANERQYAVTVKQGQTSGTLSVATTADGIHEDSDAINGRTNPLTATIQTNASYTVGTPSVATLQVKDDDPDWAFVDIVGGYRSGSSATPGITVREDAGTVTLTVRISKPIAYDTTVLTSALEASAFGNGHDFVSRLLTKITIQRMTQEVQITETIIYHPRVENTEFFTTEIDVLEGKLTARNGIIRVNITDHDTLDLEFAAERRTLVEGEPIKIIALIPEDTGNCLLPVPVTLNFKPIGQTDVLSVGNADQGLLLGACSATNALTLATLDDTTDEGGYSYPSLRYVGLSAPGHLQGRIRVAGETLTLFSVEDNDGAAARLRATSDSAAMTPSASSIDIDVLANDLYPGGDRSQMTVSQASDPANGSATIVNNKVRYTPDSSFSGTETFTYTASGGDHSDTANIRVVVPAEDAPVWTAAWNSTSIAEGGTTTLTIQQTNSNHAIADADEVTVTLQLGRNEGSADNADITVKDHADAVLPAREITSNSHHNGGWLYLNPRVTFGQAKTKALTIEALDDPDGAETLAIWVYVNGHLAAQQQIAITTQ